MSLPAPEVEALKSRLRSMWMAGDFGQIARFGEHEAENFIARLGITPGTRVLDIACGTGNLSIPAARAGAVTTGVDIAANLLEQARQRAAAEGLTIQFDEGDAENLSYEDESFDLVVSMYGAMFAPRPEKVAAEMARVTRPGGAIAMANWTPDGFVGQMFKTTAAHVPPPAGMAPPVLWGDEATVRERLSDRFSDVQLQRRTHHFIYPFNVAETVEFFRRYYGPTQRAFEAAGADKENALRRDLEDLWSKHNRATDGTAHVEAEYLEVRARRR